MKGEFLVYLKENGTLALDSAHELQQMVYLKGEIEYYWNGTINDEPYKPSKIILRSCTKCFVLHS